MEKIKKISVFRLGDRDFLLPFRLLLYCENPANLICLCCIHCCLPTLPKNRIKGEKAVKKDTEKIEEMQIFLITLLQFCVILSYV